MLGADLVAGPYLPEAGPSLLHGRLSLRDDAASLADTALERVKLGLHRSQLRLRAMELGLGAFEVLLGLPDLALPLVGSSILPGGLGFDQPQPPDGLDPAAARRLYRSHLRALLPPDVGLLLHGEHLVLDFSARHFDALELSRMLALADQIVAHVPAPKGME